MSPQAHVIGQDYSVYYDLIAVVVFLILCMIACSFWLAHRKRSAKFIGAVWIGFIVLVSLGTLGVALSIHSQRVMWWNTCSQLVASYASSINRLDHWKIQPGNPEVFSDWSPPLVLTANNSVLLPAELHRRTSSDHPPLLHKLAVPEGVSGDWQNFTPSAKPIHVQRRNQWAVAALTGDSEAFDRCTQAINVRWNPVSGATTYRLQWGEARGIETEWMTVYTGSQPFCSLTAPKGLNIALRVRAEDGTPEDDPEFNRIIDILDAPVRADRLVGYAYTLRAVDQEVAQFIAAPISDANHNGLIDVVEVPSDIGELHPLDRQLQYVLENQVRTIDLCPYYDRWGRWLTIAEPLWTPDGAIDGILGVDFNVDRVRKKMFHERIYPLCLFILVTFSYFGAFFSISNLQIKERAISRLAAGLREINSQLTEAKNVTEKALQAKTLFLTNVSHEFRTPLNALLGFTEILDQQTKKCVEEANICAEAIRHMRENGKILLELVDNILSVASMYEDHMLRLKIVPVNIRCLVTEVANALRSRAENKSLSLTVIDPPEIPEWIGSSLPHLQQVLILLVGNAIKFTQQGSISIRYGVSPEPNMLYISVSDTGIGIAPEMISSIFKPFLQSDPSLTRQYGGMGIGLSVAQQSAEILNGSITVESQLEQGSTFTFTFPELPVNPSLEETPKDSGAVTVPNELPAPPIDLSSRREMFDGAETLCLTDCRILYVEDAKINQIVLSRQLEETGAMVEFANNGQIGIEKIVEAEKQGKPFDIILMDMQMPVLDGYGATRLLRNSGYSKPIIAVTAHALPGDREKTLEAGCSAYISKPVDSAQLVETIHSFWKR